MCLARHKTDPSTLVVSHLEHLSKNLNAKPRYSTGRGLLLTNSGTAR